jgi:hypothetical protein
MKYTELTAHAHAERGQAGAARDGPATAPDRGQRHARASRRCASDLATLTRTYTQKSQGERLADEFHDALENLLLDVRTITPVRPFTLPIHPCMC